MNNNNSKFQYLFFSNLSLIEKNLYKTKIYNFIKHLRFEYNSFSKWYNHLYDSTKGLLPGREIVICQINKNIAGVAILKKSTEESKICTLRVAAEYQHMGIGKELVNKSINWLENEKPLITVRQSLVPQFDSLFSYFGFNKEETYRSYYKLFSTEVSFNGILPDKPNFFERIIPANMTDFLKNHITEDFFTPTELSDLYIKDFFQNNFSVSF